MIYGAEQVGEEISFDTFNELKNDFGSTVSKPLYTLVLALNSNKKPTNSKAVRTALNLAFDRDLIIKKVFLTHSQDLIFCLIKALKMPI